jgi:hypothetical protein
MMMTLWKGWDNGKERMLKETMLWTSQEDVFTLVQPFSHSLMFIHLTTKRNTIIRRGVEMYPFEEDL